MQCKTCGMAVPDTSIICPQCGKSVEGATASTGTTAPLSSYAAPAAGGFSDQPAAPAQPVMPQQPYAPAQPPPLYQQPYAAQQPGMQPMAPPPPQPGYMPPAPPPYQPVRPAVPGASVAPFVLGIVGIILGLFIPYFGLICSALAITLAVRDRRFQKSLSTPAMILGIVGASISGLFWLINCFISTISYF